MQQNCPPFHMVGEGNCFKNTEDGLIRGTFKQGACHVLLIVYRLLTGTLVDYVLAILKLTKRIQCHTLSK